VYVDDLMLMSNRKETIDEVVNHLRTKFEEITLSGDTWAWNFILVTDKLRLP
jgi:hypothetical protein